VLGLGKVDGIVQGGPKLAVLVAQVGALLLLRAITDENLPGEWPTGPAVGKEAW
jgi:hypothetical protein